MPHYPSRQNCTWRHCNTHKRVNPTLRAAKVPRRVHPSNVNKSKRVPIRDYHSSRLLSTQIQTKKGAVPNILSNTRTKVYSRGRLQHQTHCMGLPTNKYKRQRITESHTRTKLLMSINKEANILTYRRQENPRPAWLLCNQRNHSRIHRCTVQLRPYLGLFSNNSNCQHLNNNTKTYTTLT